MTAWKNRIGERFGRLIIMSVYSKGNTTMWNCQCDCGNQCIVSSVNLLGGSSVSCGCYRREWAAAKTTIHGLRKHPLYTVWSCMKDRCMNIKSDAYKWYGARGIRVCDEWVNDPKEFIEWGLNNGWESGLEIDRRDNDGIYSPSNCWFTTTAGHAFNKRNTNLFELNGTIYNLKQLNEISADIPKDIIRQRIQRDRWDVKKAISTPITTSTLWRPVLEYLSSMEYPEMESDWGKKLLIEVKELNAKVIAHIKSKA